MISKLSLFLLAVISQSAWAVERDVTIDCSLKLDQSATVERITLSSARNEVALTFRDGRREAHRPVAAVGGIFGEQKFQARVLWNQGSVFIPRTSAGDVFIQYGCYLTPTVPFERCISQGSHEPAPYAGVRMNLGGRPLKFVGPTICVRVDRSPR